MSPSWNEYTDPAIIDWKRVRTALEHENTLTNQRVTWVLQTQGFLFGVYGLLTTKIVDLLNVKPPVPSPETVVVPIQILLAVICVLGIAICALLTSGVKAAHTQHECLKIWWLKKSGYNVEAHPPICGEEPKIGVTFHYYHLPALFMPTWLIFMAGIWWKPIRELLNSWVAVVFVGIFAYTILTIFVYKFYQKGAFAKSKGKG